MSIPDDTGDSHPDRTQYEPLERTDTMLKAVEWCSGG